VPTVPPSGVAGPGPRDGFLAGVWGKNALPRGLLRGRTPSQAKKLQAWLLGGWLKVLDRPAAPRGSRRSPLPMVCELKIDGNALALSYERACWCGAASRGDGRIRRGRFSPPMLPHNSRACPCACCWTDPPEWLEVALDARSPIANLRGHQRRARQPARALFAQPVAMPAPPPRTTGRGGGTATGVLCLHPAPAAATGRPAAGEPSRPPQPVGVPRSWWRPPSPPTPTPRLLPDLGVVVGLLAGSGTAAASAPYHSWWSCGGEPMSPATVAAMAVLDQRTASAA